MILKNGDKIQFIDASNELKKIPVGNWLLMRDESKKEYYLLKQPSFDLPKKIYGEEEEVVERYLNTFKGRKINTGILLCGKKGNGKTLTAKLICKESGVPIILITQPFVGEEFKSFLSSIDHEVIVYIDEFEKIYQEKEQQQEFLTILDGVFQRKKMFIFTTNTRKINEYLLNRPGRIYYLREYTGIGEDTISEIIEDLLEDTTKKQGLKDIVEFLGSISVDVLMSLIEEMNRYNESAKKSIQYLNIQLEHNTYNVRAYIDKRFHTSHVNYNPIITQSIYLEYKYIQDGREVWRYYQEDVDNMTMEVLEGEFIFRDNDNNKIVFTPMKESYNNIFE